MTVGSVTPPILWWIKVTITVIGPVTQVSINPSVKHICYVFIATHVSIFIFSGIFCATKLATLQLTGSSHCFYAWNVVIVQQLRFVWVLLSGYVKLSKSTGSVYP